MPPRMGHDGRVEGEWHLWWCGQLAAIAVIRTFLNYFLERDVEKYELHVEAEAAEAT